MTVGGGRERKSELGSRMARGSLWTGARGRQMEKMAQRGPV